MTKQELELAEKKGYKLYRIPFWLDEEEIRTEISNILKDNPTYPSIPNPAQAKTKPLPN